MVLKRSRNVGDSEIALTRREGSAGADGVERAEGPGGGGAGVVKDGAYSIYG
jgi:hypothetical protein